MSKRTSQTGRDGDGGFAPPPSFAAARIAGLACTTRRPRPGQPLWLLVHGWMCERRFWSPFLARLPTGHGAIACDLPGHGDTP